MSDASYDAIIVGGGIIGCSIAYHLPGTGFRVQAFARIKRQCYTIDDSTPATGGGALPA